MGKIHTTLYAVSNQLILLILSISFLPTNASAQLKFTEQTNAFEGLAHVGESWGASWGNLNNDIFPDLYVSNHGMATNILLNNGNGLFSNVVNQADVNDAFASRVSADMHAGVWGDMDNDGDQDLVIAESSERAKILLMQNDGAGLLSNKAPDYELAPYTSSRMPILLDYTKDGFLDVALARLGTGVQFLAWQPNTNTYLNQTSQAGISNQCRQGNYGFASDIFNEDKLLFFCMEENGIPSAVFDTSSFPFIDVSDRVDHIGTYTDALIADFDNDSLQDIVATRGKIRPSGAEIVSPERIEGWFSVGGQNFQQGFQFKANGPITLSIYAREVGDSDSIKIGAIGYQPNSIPFTLDPDDVDNYGIIEDRNTQAVYVGYDEQTETWSVYLSVGPGGGNEGAYITVDGTELSNLTVNNLRVIDLPLRPRFLLNNGQRLEVSDSRGIEPNSCGSVTTADFDNDMDLDLYMVCRTSTANLANKFYLNRGNGIFDLVTSEHGAEGLVGAGIDSGAGTGEAAVTADYNLDGLVDIFATNGNRLFPRLVKDGITGGGPNQLFANHTVTGHNWIQLDLIGTQSNRDGFGSKVSIRAGGVTQFKEKHGNYHRWSQDHTRLHFGLGNNKTANITIVWPNGSTETHNNVQVNRIYRVIQEDNLVDITPTRPTLILNDSQVIEGGNAQVVFTLSEPAQVQTTITYETQSGSAMAGRDFISQSGLVTFAVGESSRTISIPTINNNTQERNKVFTIQATNLVNANDGRLVSNVTIVDNDNPIQPPSNESNKLEFIAALILLLLED